MPTFVSECVAFTLNEVGVAMGEPTIDLPVMLEYELSPREWASLWTKRDTRGIARPGGGLGMRSPPPPVDTCRSLRSVPWARS